MSIHHEVILINMPFGNLLSPSIALGLLQASLTRVGMPAKTFHFQFRFAELIGEHAYSEIHSETHTEHLAGEYIFSGSLFQQHSDADVEQYADNILRCHANGPFDDTTYSEPHLEKLINIIVNARGEVESFLEDCLNRIINSQPRVVGFTSLFHQHIASLSLAKRIKARLPNTFVIFGGSNCEGAMGRETLRQFEFVDAVVSGEGDYVFPEIVRAVLNSESVPTIEGVFCRHRSGSRVLHQSPRNTPTIENLDALPIPDYDEYFEQLESSSLNLTRKPSLLFETSRGCWWGEKHHCTFCGLNGDTMTYRSKSAGRAFSEFIHLTERYPGCAVNVVDNILDMSYFKDFIPLLAERKHGVNLFYEVKANLKKDQLLLLREAGIKEIQPGIESLSDNVLRIMHKGVGALQNIQLLKWCKELGLKVYYNLIWGFPGESAEDYLEMSKLIPLITHLTPPIGAGTIRIDRFSPNFEQAEQLGFQKLSPHPAYRFVYPFTPEVLVNLAYFFTSEHGSTHNIPEYAKPVIDELKRWRKRHDESDLFWIEKGTRLLIWDLRPLAKEVLTVLTGYQKFCYMTCDKISTARHVTDLWRKCSDTPLDHADARDTLNSMVDLGLMVEQDGSYLALAYPRSMEGLGAIM